MAVVTSLNVVKELDAMRPVDGIVFDASLRDRVDPQWLSSKYRSGVAIGAVGMTVGQLTQFLNVPTPVAYRNSIADQIPNVAVIQIQVTASDPKDIEQFWAQYSDRIDLEGTGDDFLKGFEKSDLQIVSSQINYDLTDNTSRENLFRLLQANTRPVHDNQ